jgi:CheY-like chemotaxis protein
MADRALQVTQQQFKKEREEAFQREHAARSEAERAVRLKDEFFATVSHELRTPLNAILGWSQFLKKDIGDPEKARHAAEVIERNGKLQAKLIADLLDMSRLISGKMRVEFEGIDLSVIIDAAMESISPTAAAKGVRIDRVGERMPQQIAGDPGRIQQVVWNLLSNAVKFTPRGGRVEIEVTALDDHVEIRVSDTGEGITPKVLPNIFDRFRQGDSSITRSHGGLGIGLALVKEIVELHGGRVRATSDGEGKGATFVIELPIVTLHDSFSGAVFDSSPERALDSACLIGMRVLAVDDEPDALVMLRRILEERGAFVGSAPSAEAALAMLGDETFDCIISDIGMPFCDGYAFIAEVRRRGIQVPAIALTAFTRHEDQVQTRKAGYQAHVCKPMEAGQLLSAITSLASRVTR